MNGATALVAGVDQDLLDPSVEIDLSDATGLERTRATFEVKEVSGPTRTKKGNGQMYSIVFQSLEPIEETDNWTVTLTLVIVHPNKGFVNRNKKALRRLFEAAYGEPTGVIDELVGSIVSAEVWEDDNDFRRIGRFEMPTSDEDAPASEALTAESIGL